MIKVISAGRSGSAWLTSLFTACGLKCIHEWYPFNVTEPDAQAETEWLWNQGAFFESLSPDDIVIVLDRKEADRMKSVTRLLGERNWDDVNRLWKEFKATLLSKAHPNTFSISYESLFTSTTKELLKAILSHAGHDTSNFDNAFEFMKHMRVTNKTAEQVCRDSWGIA